MASSHPCCLARSALATSSIQPPMTFPSEASNCPSRSVYSATNHHLILCLVLLVAYAADALGRFLPVPFYLETSRRCAAPGSTSGSAEPRVRLSRRRPTPRAARASCSRHPLRTERVERHHGCHRRTAWNLRRVRLVQRFDVRGVGFSRGLHRLLARNGHRAHEVAERHSSSSKTS